MKKILCLLSCFGLTFTVASTAISCSKLKGGSNMSEAETKAKQARLREEYIDAVSKYISKYISLNASKLYLTTEDSKNNSFLSTINLGGFTINEGEKIIVELNSTQLINLNSDLDKILGLRGSLANELINNISSQAEYNFLLVGVDNIFNNFSASSTVEITQSKVENELINTVSFSMEVSFDYAFNGVIETQSITLNKVTSNISADITLISGLQNLTKNLPSQVYEDTKSGNLFSITDEDLNLSKGAFSSQENAVHQYYKGELLIRISIAINNAARKILLGSEIKFSGYKVSVSEQMYKRNIEHYISSPDYFETGMFDQHQFGGPLQDSIKNAYFDYKFGFLYFHRSKWVDNQNERILNEFNIKSHEQNFIEWGSVIVGDSNDTNNFVTLKYKGAEINLNPISFAYFYSTRKTYSQELNKLFAAWRKAWGVFPALTPGTAFSISENSTSGYSFWSIVSKNPQFPFEVMNANRPRWYDPYVKTSEFNYFQITTDNGGNTPDVKVTDNGWNVDYSKHIVDGNLTDEVLSKSLKFIITVDDVTYNLVWAKSPMQGTYIDSIIYGIEKNISIIQKTTT